jgi:hypothetical protein
VIPIHLLAKVEDQPSLPISVPNAKLVSVSARREPNMMTANIFTVSVFIILFVYA